ncbi:TniQ family protein [Pseudoalteromonas sp. OOF1S-7]|uniref:TniQ family protein n=1 Tax=Pseudoalteromonas sp. OOF1S-7 TaxID=2917757 RepID=UPI001EF477FA|nr:TniQ family protein [Pseudoalteromonas sp. OOF1S-7]
MVTTDRQLPARPRPFGDEHFLSWVTRLAFANLCEATHFTQVVLGGMDIWGGCVNGASTLRPEVILAEKTNISVASISRLYSVNFARRHYLELNSLYARSYFLPAICVSRIFRHNWIQFCPACLSEDRVAYFRNHWRVSLLPVCTRHNLNMMDRCPYCSSPINFHQLPYHEQSLSICHNCLHSLSSQYQNFCQPCGDTLYLAHLVESGISNGWVKLSKNNKVMMPLFVAGVRLIMKLFFRSKTANKAREYFGIEGPIGNDNKIAFVHLPIATRIEVLSATSQLLKHWPDRFIEICSALNLNQSTFKINEPYVPFWLYNTLDMKVKRFKAWTSDEEFFSAASFLKKFSYLVSYSNIAEVLGLDRSCHRTSNRDRIIMSLYTSDYEHSVFHWPK